MSRLPWSLLSLKGMGNPLQTGAFAKRNRTPDSILVVSKLVSIMNAATYSNTKYTPSRPFVTKFEISLKGVHSLIKIRMEMQAHNKA